MGALFDYLAEHWPELAFAVLTAIAGWFLGGWKARRNWKRKEFLDRINISLNSISEGTLRIRTLIEKRCEDVFLNRLATSSIVEAAKNTTEENAILPLPADDYWYYLNSVLNEVSEHFSIGQMRRDAGGDAHCRNYLIALTCEAAGAIRTRKVRAMVIQKSLLENLPENEPNYESAIHVTRWQTLNQLAAAWKTHPERFLDIEICV